MSGRALIVAVMACAFVVGADACVVLAWGWWALTGHVACAAGMVWWLAWEERRAS